MSRSSQPKFSSPFWRPFSGVLLCLLVAFFLLAYPLYVIRPFRYQGPRELSLALALLRFRTAAEIAMAVLALALLVLCWRAGRGVVARAGAVACALLVVACAFLSRINVYELMFNPVDRITISPASKSKLNSEEEVIAVKLGSAARAYPIRSMSYHHIFNDELAGQPIVATY